MHAYLAKSLRRSFDGGAWHGPSLADALDGVDARAALARPAPDAHSIWELTHHVTAWTGEVTRRLGGSPPGMPAEGDWPEPVTETDAAALDAAWERVRAALTASRDALLAAVASFPVERLDEKIADASTAELGGLSTFGQTLLGLAEHNAYHGGQIVLLRRLLDGTRLTGYGPTPPDPAAITES